MNRRQFFGGSVALLAAGSIFGKYLFADTACGMDYLAQDFEKLRQEMVDVLKARRIRSKVVLDAMSNVPRHMFVPQEMRSYAYQDSPLPIGSGQTISQPYIVAFMTESLDPEPGMKILEIGAGSGYQAAILAYIGCEVYTIELLPELAQRAEKTLAELKFDNVTVRCGNGYLGWVEEAPFDAIMVTAAPEKIPEKLIEQLKDGGKMIIPVGPVNALQSLKLITKRGRRTVERDLLPVRFVPMVE